MKRIAVAVVADGPSDSTSFYRALGPLGTLARTVPWLDLAMYSDWTWATFKMVDVVFLHRPFNEKHLQIARTARFHFKKVWMDYDDYLLGVPPENPMAGMYAQIDCLREILKKADVITVSTEHLKQLLAQETQAEIIVIPNAFDDSLFQWRKKNTMVKTKPTIAWRGSNTHGKDLMEVRDEFVLLAQVLGAKAWQFDFWGHRPFFIWDAIVPHTKPGHYEITDIVEYHARLTGAAPAVVVVPLADNDFNRAKSNCAWLEATMAGSVVVAPAWEQWKRKGVITYAGPSDFGRAVMEAAGMTDQARQKMNYEAWQEIHASYLLSKVNGMRESVLAKLVRGKL